MSTLNQFWKQAKQQLDRHQCVPISTVMTSDVITLKRASTLREALQTFRTHSIRHLVVVDDEFVLQGIFTKRDMLGLESVGGSNLERSIVSVMHTQIQMVEKQTCIRMVAELMLKHKIGSVPIVEFRSKKPILVGIVTEADFVRAFALAAHCTCGAMNE